MTRHGTTAGSRHPRCGGTWRPLRTPAGRALVCDGCADQLDLPVLTWSCGSCGRAVTGNARARREARLACTAAHADGSTARPVARRRRR